MIRRIVATLLISFGMLGVALCTLGVVSIWRAADQVAAAADDTLLLVSDTLDDLDYSLGVTSRTLDEVAIAMDGLYTTTLDIGEALSGTRVTVDEMASLAGGDLPRSIESSLVALEALEETARVIDQFLSGLQRLGIGSYNPDVPMDEAVAQASTGLQPVPDNLRTMARGLEQTGESLEGVRGGMGLMGDHMLGLQRNVADADMAVDSHRLTMLEVRERVQGVRQNIAGPIRAAAWGTSILLVWIGLSQLAIVRWGIGLWPSKSPGTNLSGKDSPENST